MVEQSLQKDSGNIKLPLVIVNPKSAGGATKTRWAGIASDLRAHFGPFQVAFTKKSGDGIRLAQRGADSGRKLIIACGGDGTANEVCNGILRSENPDVEMGLLPSGTGGDFRRTIDIPLEPRDAAKVLRNGTTKSIDIGKVTFIGKTGEEESRYFLNVSSFGISAEIGKRVKANSLFRWIPFGKTIQGKANFAYSALQEVLEIEPLLVNVSLDNADAKPMRTLNFCICNARYFGGGMKIAPDAKIDDGLLDVINIGDIRTARIIRKGYTLYRGSHLALREVKSTLAKRISVSAADEKIRINIDVDGELLGRLPATFEIVPMALKMRVSSKTK